MGNHIDPDDARDEGSALLGRIVGVIVLFGLIAVLGVIGFAIHEVLEIIKHWRMW